jgi:hypothetical protein
MRLHWLMLFKQEILRKIKNGTVKIAFRKWSKPTVKAGGTLITPAGVLGIKSIEPILYKNISEDDVREAGYEKRQQLDNELAFKETGLLYKIEFDIQQEDPRIALRTTSLSAKAFFELKNKLDKLDCSGKYGAWTQRVLTLFLEQPERTAVYYAGIMNVEKDWFKLNVRKLKNEGLTISYEYGYGISPRGKQYLKRLEKKRT